MSVIPINEEFIPIKAYLRADCNSQKFKYSETNQDLVTPEMFWDVSDGVYLDYTKIKNRSIQVSSGISAKAGRRTLHDSLCDDWINHNIYHLNSSKLFVIEGYAGCGKTTFINHFIRFHQGFDNCFSIDVGSKWSYSEEPFMFFNESLNGFCRLVGRVMAKSHRVSEKIWNCFFELGNDDGDDDDSNKLGAEITNAVLGLKKVKKQSKPSDLRNNMREYLYDQYSRSSPADYVDEDNAGNIWHSIGRTQAIVTLMILLKCAECLICKSSPNKFSFVFDDLDIMTNPAIPAENVFLFWGVIQRYKDFRDAYYRRMHRELPHITIYIAVRKVLFTHITSYLPHLEMNHPYDSSCAATCDISNLYSSQDILGHRISYWASRVDDPFILGQFLQIKELISVQSSEPPIGKDDFDLDYLPRHSMNLDAFVNHNYRAFSNVLSTLLDSPQFSKILMNDYRNSQSTQWQKVATLVFSVSLLYRNGEVWSTMGFGCTDFNLVDYPTTLGRLLLNYLYAARQGQNLHQYIADRTGVLTNANVSLRSLVNDLCKVNFLTVDINLGSNELDELYQSATAQTEDLIITRLADMCARTSKTASAYGYDVEDDELWRRPLYFTGGLRLKHTAASNNELKDHFKKRLETGTDSQIMFSITDEGFILICDVVASFEFYSARYCHINSAKPLHQAISKEEINNLIRPVFEAVQRCCERNILFKDQYLMQYQVSLDQYLQCPFHPRTKPRFVEKRAKQKKLSTSSFRPQLHIIRVIYTHIAYFNEIKNSFSHYGDMIPLCECLTEWIAAYLALYKQYFYDLLKNTVCRSDNNVFVKLNSLKNEQLKQYAPGGRRINIDICHRMWRSRRKKQHLKENHID